MIVAQMQTNKQMFPLSPPSTNPLSLLNPFLIRYCLNSVTKRSTKLAPIWIAEEYVLIDQTWPLFVNFCSIYNGKTNTAQIWL